MKIKETNIVFYCLLICLVTICLVYVVRQRTQKKIAVVDTVKLFDGFNMKKELEDLAKVKLQAISKQVDSIKNQWQLAAAHKNGDSLQKLTYAYNCIKTELEREYKKSNTDINEQVWKRLNPVIAEYGKKNGLRLIIGANGMGTVLYTDDYTDLTNEVIKYVNKRYAEGS